MEIRLRDGNILKYDSAIVMGIINVTPDSFFEGSRVQDAETLRIRVRQLVAEGASIIDVGAYSTRPDGVEVSEEEEMARLKFALPVIKEELMKDYPLPNTHYPIPNNSHLPRKQVLLSIDTFRANIARRCVEDFSADIINDISGGTLDAEMLRTVAELRVPYILMHMRGTPQTMQCMTDYPDGVTNEVISFYREQLSKLDYPLPNNYPLPESQTVILDPGFGFAKTIEQNYQLFSNLSAIKRAFPDNPLLVGISRKSMIYKLLDKSPDEVLNESSVLNALAIAQGADILRVHDVAPAVSIIKQIPFTH